MEIEGTAHGNRIELDEPLAFSEGTRVRVSVVPVSAPRCGSPDAVLKIVGTLAPDEADALLEAVKTSRSIDPALWS